MRKFRNFVFATLLALSASGCLMIIGTDSKSAKIGKHKRIVEIDGALYVVDLENNTAKKLDADNPPEGVTTVEIETKTGGN